VPDGGTSPSSVEQVTPARGHIATSPGGSRTRPSVIQLSNSSSAAGTSSLCYFLTTLAVLPQDYGGKRHGVVWLDADGRFSATRLKSVLINYLSTKFPRLSSCERNAICHEAFRHVHIFRPQSSAQLVSTLASLPGYLLGTSGSTTHFSATWSMGLVILDSATAFYWQDRFEFEIARLESLGSDENSGARSPARSSRTLATISELRKLQKIFDCTIVFTSTPHMKISAMTTSVVPAIATNDGRRLPQEPPGVSPWTAFATLNLSVFQEQVRPFAVQMSLEECQRDQPKRLVAVAKGRAIVSVDWNTSDTWPGGVRDAVNRLDGQGSFAMRITSSGIAVED
jgi:Rad51